MRESTSITLLERKGLTWDWSKLELNKQYFIGRRDVLTGSYWRLIESGIREQAKKLNSDILTWEDSIENGWCFLLRPKKDKPLNPASCQTVVRQRCFSVVNSVAPGTQMDEKVKGWLYGLDFVDIVVRAEREFNCTIKEGVVNVLRSLIFPTGLYHTF